jgi:hypothetical protein
LKVRKMVLLSARVVVVCVQVEVEELDVMASLEEPSERLTERPRLMRVALTGAKVITQ